MADIKTLIYENNIKGKVIASDLDGTLLEGDLGETVFFLLLAMKARKTPLGDIVSFLKMVRQEEGLECDHENEVGDVLSQYLWHMQRAELLQAYALIADYLSFYSEEEIHTISMAVLTFGIPRKQFQLICRNQSFDLMIHALPDPWLTSLIKESFSRGAEIRIISGSPQSIVEGYCMFQGFPKSVARGIVKDAGGKTVVPYGKEKLEILTREGFTKPYIGLGDSRGDFDMLLAAEHPFVRKTSPIEVLEEAKQHHWEII